jgi:hypothetical protein
MEEHFLKDFVSGEKGISPEPWYNPDGDCIIYQVVDDATVAQRIDEVLTIYRSFESGKAIGFQINKFGWNGFALEVESNKQEVTKVSLYALLLAAYDTGQKTINRRLGYATAFQSLSRETEVDINDLELAVN